MPLYVFSIGTASSAVFKSPRRIVIEAASEAEAWAQVNQKYANTSVELEHVRDDNDGRQS